MKHTFIKYSIQVIIMLAIISKAFGLSKPSEDIPLMPRQINLSGNVLHFAMPENFSHDMPAEDMIEFVDLTDKSIYKDDKKFTLIRRWWDFKDNGFLGKEYGTLMMSLYIKDTPESLSINTLNPLDFIDILIDNVNKNKAENDDSLTVYSDYFTAYKEEWFNEQRWLSYTYGPLDGSQYTFLYAIPITDKQYLIAEFTSAPNNNINIRSFIDSHTDIFIKKILNSFNIKYLENNLARQAVLNSNTPTLQQLIDNKVLQLEKKHIKN